MTTVLEAPAPFANAVLLILGIALAGIAHVLWLRSPYSKRFSQPIDCGLSWRGCRLLGDNKMLRGLMVMPPAAAASLALLGGLREFLPAWLASGAWNLSLSGYALLGFGCGLAFMLAELPNSFLKRRLGVAPGAAAGPLLLKSILILIDRLDSALGVLILVSLTLPMQPMTWFWVLALGPAAHTAFSIWLFVIGEKARAL